MIQFPICHLGSTIDPIWNTCVNFITPQDELPIPNEITNLYLDFETTSEIIDIPSTNPHRNCKILGVSVLFDSELIPYYIPVRHAYLDEEGEYKYRQNNLPNISVERVHDWLKKLVTISKYWVNHNIKYDWHVFFNEIGFRPPCKLIDTLILSKLSNLEEKFSYGLTEMMKYIGIDITSYEDKIKICLGKLPDGTKVQDYGLIPPDIMAPYAAVDTLCVRHLQHWLKQNTHTECQRIIDLELDILPILIQTEQIGLKTDTKKLEHDWRRILPLQTTRVKRIKRMSGYELFQPDKKESLKELFCNVLGWELDFTAKSLENFTSGKIKEDEMTVSFGYASLMKHKNKNAKLVNCFIRYQEAQKLLTSFIQPYVETHISGFELLNPNFNQIVRTGRMSCTNPNMQQLSPEAKEYIIPYSEDYLLVEFDLSQIEFRVIVHYIRNQKAIQDFNRDPTTDFHTWVADMCKIPRKQAKNVNFMLGYGGGKGKCIAMLSELPDIIGKLKTQDEINQRAYNVYQAYHSALPELKPTQYRCSDVLRSRGYVRTLLGRHRNLPRQLHFKAFNSVCQGTAADIFKDILVRLRKFMSIDCLLHAVVHDSFLFSIRKERVQELIPEIKYEIERPIEGVNFSVPLQSSCKVSNKNWRYCE